LTGFLQTGKLLKIDGLSSSTSWGHEGSSCNRTSDGGNSQKQTSTASPSLSQLSRNDGDSKRGGIKSCPCSPLDTRNEPVKRSRISSCHDHQFNEYQPQAQQDCQVFPSQTVAPLMAPIVASASSSSSSIPLLSSHISAQSVEGTEVTTKFESEDSVDVDDYWENPSIPMDTRGGYDPLVAVSPPILRSRTVSKNTSCTFEGPIADDTGYHENLGATCGGSNVWKHFTKLPEKTVALCIICGKYIKTSKQSSSSNLWCHLRTHKIYPY